MYAFICVCMRVRPHGHMYVGTEASAQVRKYTSIQVHNYASTQRYKYTKGKRRDEKGERGGRKRGAKSERGGWESDAKVAVWAFVEGDKNILESREHVGHE